MIRFWSAMLIAVLTISVCAAQDPDLTQARVRLDLTLWSTGQSMTVYSPTYSNQGVSGHVPGSGVENGDAAQFGARRIIPWFDIKHWNPEPQVRSTWNQQHQDAVLAHHRFKRGDVQLALELYTQLGETYQWQVGPQSAEYAFANAMISIDHSAFHRGWYYQLMLMRSMNVLSINHERPGHISEFLGWFNTEYDLITDLPPVVLPVHDESIDPKPVSFTRYIETTVSSGQPSRLAFFDQVHNIVSANPYGNGRCHERELSELVKRSRGFDQDPGVSLILDCLHALHQHSPTRREAARRSLERQSRIHTGSWVEAWSRLFIGLSLMSETESIEKERGLIELLHVVVRLRGMSYPTAKLAAQVAQQYLTETNRPEWAKQVQKTLESLSALHQAS